MNETENNEQCCEINSTDPSCSCVPDECDCGKPAGRKMPKAIICLVVLLAVISIVTYKVTSTSASSNDAMAFDFGQMVSETAPSEGGLPQAGQNLGEYLETLNELNTVALDNDVVFVFIPDSGNILADSTTKAAITEAKQTLEDSKIKVGLYTLSCDSPDYSAIAGQVELPIVFVSRKDASATTIPGSEVNVDALLQAYLACCDTSSGCCGTVVE